MPYLVFLSMAFLLSGCGGGGGPGSPNVRVNAPNSDVDFVNPNLAGKFQLFTSGSATSPVQDIFVQDLNNDSREEVVIAGRQSQSAFGLGGHACNDNLDCKKANYENSQLTLYEFNANDELENQTSSWFTGTENQIIGAEPGIAFGDFNGDNNTDMVIGHSTDMDFLGDTVVFTNSGISSFGRDDYATNLWTHDVEVHDINGDGLDDVILGGYGNPVVMLGDVSGSMIQVTTDHFGMSGLAAGDFLGDGSTTFVFVDSSHDTTLPDSATRDIEDTRLFSFTQTGANTGTFTELAKLPNPIFESSDFDSLFAAGVERSHDIRALPFDFNNDGSLDVVVVSVSTNPNDGVNRTEVQFLQNNGGGNFVDVTDGVRVGWDNAVNGDYNAQLKDINDDGLTDILLSSQSFNNKESTRVLIQTKEGKYIQSFTEVFSNFANTVRALETDKSPILNTIRFLTGPNGDKFLTTLVTLNDGKNALYTSRLGDAGGSTAQASIDLIQQVWPYVTDEVAAQILAGTAFTNFEGFDPREHGFGIIDLERALLPVGELRMPLEGHNGTVPIQGSLSGVNFGELDRVQAIDSFGRGFEIDIDRMHNPQQQDTWYDVNFTDDSYTRMDYAVDYVVQNGMFNYSPTDESGNYTMGLRHIKLAKDWYVQGQYTVLAKRNPWFHMDGMWGTINSSNTFETVVTHLRKGFTFNLGTMYTNTDYEKGLVTYVDPLTSVWSEVSWRDAGFRAAIGTMPYLVDGGITLSIPRSIDVTGAVQYSEFKYRIRNNFAEYASLEYTKNIDFKSSYSLVAYSNGYGFNQAKLNINFDF